MWEIGRDNSLVTWSLGKLGILAKEAKELQPRSSEQWACKIIKDTRPGERKGCYVLFPLRPVHDDEVVEEDAPVNVDLIAQTNEIVRLTAEALCPGTRVEIVSKEKTVRFFLRPPADGQAVELIGYQGKLVDSLRTVVTNILVKGGVRCWLDVISSSVEDTVYAVCETCFEAYSDESDFENSTDPGGSTDDGRVYRLCGVCTERVFA
jgi:predicted RNA-binding protein YlqC (UPF0109 family)